MIIELRSDTFTTPTAAMLDAMHSATVGDDVFGEDPTVNALQQKVAALLGMQAGLYCPTGTMANQIAIKCHTQPGHEVICDELSHIYQYEGGGIAFNSGCSVKLLHGNSGRLTASLVANNINNKDDVHKAITSLVSLENTCNRAGGSCYNMDDMREISNLCAEHALPLHLDGARLYNAIVAQGEKASDYGTIFTSISLCLSKGLGAPIGSVLVGSKQLIQQATRIRKVLGGGMRQAGYLAAAGIYALDNHVQLLQQDHAHAQAVAQVLDTKSFVHSILPVATNIIIFTVQGEQYTAAGLVHILKEKGVHCIAFSATQIRFVFHLNVTDVMVDALIEILKKL